jgi:hypothetical protein
MTGVRDFIRRRMVLTHETVMDGFVYDVTPYLTEHPGGVESLVLHVPSLPLHTHTHTHTLFFSNRPTCLTV